MKIKLVFIKFLIFFFITTHLTHAQNDPEQLFATAKELANKKEYQSAISILNQIITLVPQNKDYVFYLSRLLFWNNNTTQAKILLLNTLKEANLTSELLQLWIQIEMHLNNYQQVLALATRGETEFKEEAATYLLTQAKVHYLLKNNDEAFRIIDQLSKQDPKNKQAKYFKMKLLQVKKNKIAIGYLNTSFFKPKITTSQFGSIEYQHNATKNTLIGRVNYGTFFNKTALQFEMDLYPKIGKKSYFYLNAGYSNANAIFPKTRLGAEFYHEEKKSSSSIGSRYLYFVTENVLLFTGHIGRNWEEVFVSYRPFVNNKNNEWFVSHILNFKKTFTSNESFIQLDLQYGNLPYYFFNSDDFKRINAYRIGLNCNYRINNHWFVQPIFMYEFEEYFPTKFRNKYNFQLILSKRF